MAGVKQFLHVLPRPAAVCGVSDYARNLGTALQQGYGAKSQFLHIRGKLGGGLCNGKGGLINHEEVDIREDQSGVYVVVHFTPAGMGIWGMPFKLLWDLRRLMRSQRCRGVTVFFHEVIRRGRMWKRAYWIEKSLQRGLRWSFGQRTVNLTNCEGSVRWLTQAGLRVHECLPVFSNFGEANESDLLPFDGRHGAVVLGLEDKRARVHKTFRALKVPGIETALGEVTDIGPGKATSGGATAIAVTELGVVPQDEIARRLQRTKWGIIDLPALEVGKSTIVASYLAYGVVPLRVGGAVAEDFDRPRFAQILGINDAIEGRTDMRALQLHNWKAQRRFSVCEHAGAIWKYSKSSGQRQDPC